VDRKFPKGIHPSEMNNEEAKAYWEWFYMTKELEPLPKDTDMDWED
jgi:hypothetical protein